MIYAINLPKFLIIMTKFIDNRIKRLLIVFAFLATGVVSQAYDFEFDGLFYSILSEEESTVEVSSPDYLELLEGTVIVPETVQNNDKTYRVIAIGEGAFCWQEKMLNIILPPSIIEIKDKAFVGCESLLNITLSDSLKSLGYGAFENCFSLQTIDLPESLEIINRDCFWGCRSLSSMYIPSSVTLIDECAFSGTYSLSSIDVSPENKNFASYCGALYTKNLAVFLSCPGGLEILIFPDELLSIGSSGFNDCKALTEIVVSENSLWGTYDGALYDDDNLQMLIKCPNAKENIELSKNLKELSPHAFNGCYLLKTVDLPETINEISYCAFLGCSSLESIKIPESVNLIDEAAFAECTSLTEINIPNSVKKINDGAFQTCLSLKRVTLPDQLDAINDRLFTYCESLTDIEIPESVTYIGESAFWFCGSLTHIKIPDSVTTIGPMAFMDCQSFDKVILPPALEYIGYGAFTNLWDLSSITCLAKKVPELGNDCFWRKTFPLYVYESVIDDYKNSDWAQYFTEILPLDESLYPDAEEILLNIESAELKKGGTLQLKATVLPENTGDKRVTWSSMDKNVVSVSDNGLVTAISVGQTIVTASCGEVSAQCVITVIEDAGVESLLANPDNKISIYSNDGMLIRKDCKAEDLKTLRKGIYIIVSGKERYKISI